MLDPKVKFLRCSWLPSSKRGSLEHPSLGMELVVWSFVPWTDVVEESSGMLQWSSWFFRRADKQEGETVAVEDGGGKRWCREQCDVHRGVPLLQFFFRLRCLLSRRRDSLHLGRCFRAHGRQSCTGEVQDHLPVRWSWWFF